MRNPYLILFLSLHIAVLVGGVERYFWPIHAYHMFSRVSHLRTQSYLNVMAYSRNGTATNWPELGQAFLPFPTPSSIHGILNKFDIGTSCRYLLEVLQRSESLSHFEIMRQQGLTSPAETWAIVDRNTSCESLR